MRFWLRLFINGLGCCAVTAQAATQQAAVVASFLLYGFYAAIFALVVLAALLIFLFWHLKQQKALHANLIHSMEDSNQLFNLLFNNSPIGFIIQDSRGKIIRANTATSQILGMPVTVIDQIQPLREMIPDPQARQQFSEYYEKMLREPIHLHNWEIEITTPSNHQKCIRLNGQTMVSNGEIKGAFWMIEDVTQEHKIRKILEHLSTTDGLTGLLNRRAFLQRWKEEYPRALRYGYPMTLVVIDLDHFKQLNDQWGHHVGDEVLKWFASQMRQHLRSSDFIARLGGEEFSILIPHTDEPAACRAIEHLHHVTREHGVKTETGEQLYPTFSAGVYRPGIGMRRSLLSGSISGQTAPSTMLKSMAATAPPVSASSLRGRLYWRSYQLANKCAHLRAVPVQRAKGCIADAPLFIQQIAGRVGKHAPAFYGLAGWV